jgi:signal peptidase II
MLVFLIGVVALDQISKGLVVSELDLGERREVLPFLDLVRVSNEGLAFGFLGDSSQGLVLIATLLALTFVIGWFVLNKERRWAAAAVGLLAGGAAGNLIDRLLREGVVDFIDFPAWPSFNVADIAITLGAGLLAISALSTHDPESPPTEPRGRGL